MSYLIKILQSNFVILVPSRGQLVNEFFGSVAMGSPHMKLCTVPESTKLVYEDLVPIKKKNKS